MNKRTLFGLLLILVVLLGAALLLLDFRALRGETGVQSEVSRYSFSFDEGSSVAYNQQLTVYVDARDELRKALEPALSDALATNPYFGNITVGSLPPAPSAGSVLVIAVDPDRLLWTPVYSRADLNVSVAYASDGEVAWIDEETVTLASEDGSPPVVRVRGDFQVDNSAYGFISGPGYMHYLGDEIASQINESLQAQLDTAGPVQAP